jgi:hypothetical protein
VFPPSQTDLNREPLQLFQLLVSSNGSPATTAATEPGDDRKLEQRGRKRQPVAAIWPDPASVRAFVPAPTESLATSRVRSGETNFYRFWNLTRPFQFGRSRVATVPKSTGRVIGSPRRNAMNMWTRTMDKDDEADRRIRQDLDARLQAIREEKVPDRLLALARELQDLLRKSGKND